MDEVTYNLEEQFDLFIRKMNYNRNEMPRQQVQQLKDAWYAGAGQMMLILMKASREESFEKIDAVEKQVKKYWER